MSEQVLDLRGSWRLIRRSWKAVAALALLGAGAGTAYEVMQPPQFSATALVLLPTTGTAGTATRVPVTTDAGIATSAAVLVPAGRQIGSSLPLPALQKRVTASATTSGVLAITATGGSARQAEALANGVADNFVTFMTSGGLASSAHAVVGLQSEAAQLNRQLAVTQQQLVLERQRLAAEAPGSPAWQHDSSVVASLTSEQTSLTLELNTLRGQTAQAQFGQASLAQGTQVIQRATTANPPQVTSVALVVVLGAIAGLLVGCVAILAWRRRDSRVWSRDGLASALGAPVVLAFEVLPRRSSKEWVALLETYQPSSSERWNVRRALHELGAGERGPLRLAAVAFDDDPGGVSLALQTAVVAACSGVETSIAMVAVDQRLATLQTAFMEIVARGSVARPCLSVRADRGESYGFDVPELTVALFFVDRRHPQLDELGARDAKVALSVSAGAVSAEQLAQLAIAATDGGQPVQAIFVANPTPGDHTVGVVSDGAWPALMLPNRRTREMSRGQL